MLKQKLNTIPRYWCFKRLIFDYNLRKQYKAEGKVTIDHKKYSETGQWVHQCAYNTEFHQYYGLEFSTTNIINVYFDTACRKLFFQVNLNITKTYIDHVCNTDHYQGILYSACHNDRIKFYLSWRVKGSRKNYLMKTIYQNKVYCCNKN